MDATYPADLATVSAARRLAAEAAHALGSDPDTAALLVSELASNAVRHAHSDYTLTLDTHGDRLRVTVTDHSTDLPAPPTLQPAEAVGGRGMWLVDTMSAEWGIDLTGNGKSIWFDLPAAAATAAAA